MKERLMKLLAAFLVLSPLILIFVHQLVNSKEFLMIGVCSIAGLWLTLCKNKD
jgi:NADH:ubiquinone oxidoreductase subunit 6 (subunit J)